MPSTVLIATPEHLAILTQRSDLADALTFSDTEALRALDAIVRQRPAVVGLEKTFAATSRGAALINRIKADPSLASCEIRILAHDEPAPRPVEPPAPPPAPPGPPAAADAQGVPPPAPPLGPLDYRGTRRAARFRIVDGIEVAIDGNPAALIDLSIIGAMVISPTILRPNQRVRMSLPDAARPIRFGAGVAWAAFELLKTGPRYRAGLEFFDADVVAVQKFIDTNKQS